MHTIGVDIGGTKIAAGVVDEEGRILRRVRRETPATDVTAIESAVGDAVRELVARGDSARQPLGGVGVAAAGFVDVDRAVVRFAPNLAWRDEPLKADLEADLGLPVVVENDANAAAWGEFRFGSGRDVEDMVLLTVGTGLGGGIVLNGRMLRGAYGFAAEVGHMRVVPDGHRCGCGNRGCWEQYASGSALEREARDLARSGTIHAGRLLDLAGGDAEALTGPMVTRAAMEGDAAAVELLADLGRWLGEGTASLAAVLDPEVVVIGGGVIEAGDLLIEPARAAFRRQLTARGHRPELRMVEASLGNDAGIIGAAALAAELVEGSVPAGEVGAPIGAGGGPSASASGGARAGGGRSRATQAPGGARATGGRSGGSQASGGAGAAGAGAATSTPAAPARRAPRGQDGRG